MVRVSLSLTTLEERVVASVAAAPTVSPNGPAVVAHVSGRVAGHATSLRNEFEAIRQDADLPALTGGVIRDGKLAELVAVGVRVRGNPATVTADDRFHLGSNGKSMTATLAAVMVEQGTIRWNTTIAQAFPEVRNRLNPAYASVTLEELLNHRSGIGTDETPEGSARVERFQSRARWAAEGRQLLVRDWLTTVPPAVKRGEFLYSNVGYTVAGAMLERMAGRGFEWLLKERVFAPLGMTSAVFGMPLAGGRIGQPGGHGVDGSPEPLPSPVDILSPSGGVSMSMADWAKYLRVHLGERVNGVRLLRASSLAKLHTPDPRIVVDLGGRYGFGWVSTDTPAGPKLSHYGAWAGFGSVTILVPKQKVAVFLATNQLSESAIPASDAAIAALFNRR